MLFFIFYFKRLYKEFAKTANSNYEKGTLLSLGGRAWEPRWSRLRASVVTFESLGGHAWVPQCPCLWAWLSIVIYPPECMAVHAWEPGRPLLSASTSMLSSVTIEALKRDTEALKLDHRGSTMPLFHIYY